MRFSLLIIALAVFAGFIFGSFDPSFAREEIIFDPPQYTIKYKEAIRQFYDSRGGEPYWDRGEAKDLIEALEESWTHGLNPQKFHLNAIYALKDDEARRDDFDRVLSDAYIKYGRALSGIRVNPKDMNSHKRYWKKPLEPSVLLDFLRLEDFDDAAEQFMPKGYTYNALRRELVELVKDRDVRDETPIRIKGTLKPYQEHQAVPQIRRRLDVRGPEEGVYYDDRLAAAVMIFQRESGLAPDGLIGPATLRALNVTRKDKIYQLIANLERLRWVPEEKPGRFVVVNVPSAMLWAIEDGDIALEMPVVVGRKKRPTNIFITEITGVRLNPTWTVPPTIKEEDIIPKLMEDHSFLENKGMALMVGHGKNARTIDPSWIDWEAVQPEDLQDYRMVQVPGANNPLGRVRVLMPNGYNIYLHDTNERHHFQRQNRALSSGCVRMEKPHEMARFILDADQRYSQEHVDKILREEELTDLFLQNTIPVYLLYYTAWVGEDDDVIFANDLYGYDKMLIEMLSKLDGYYIPVDNHG